MHTVAHIPLTYILYDSYYTVHAVYGILFSLHYIQVRVKILGRTIHITPPGTESEICMSCDSDCGHPGDIDHGTVDVSGGTTIGDTATYQCNQHFQLNGEDTRTCQDDGTWSGTAPTCQGEYS